MLAEEDDRAAILAALERQVKKDGPRLVIAAAGFYCSGLMANPIA